MAMISFKKEFLINELGLPDSALEDKIVATDRCLWYHEIIFECKDKYYKTWYTECVTEIQDERPWGHNDDDIECVEVEQKEVVVKKWVEVVNDI